MAFSLIVPAHKVSPGKLTVSCNSMGGGPCRLQVSMPHLMFDTNFPKADKVDLLWGTGTDAGKLLITAPAGGGHFKPTFLKHCVLLRLPPREDTPDFKMAPIDPEHRQTPDGLVVMLPEWAWNKERQTAIRKAKEQVARERAAEQRGGR
jgi:hypothetical protein